MRKYTFGMAVAAAALAVLALGGCKEKGPDRPTMVWWNVGTSQPGFAEDMKVIADYVEEKIGIRVEIKQAGWSEAAQRFNTMINVGEYFDIMFVEGGAYNRFTTLGVFEDLTDLLPAEAPELWNYIPQVLWDGVRVKGRIFSVPTYKDSSSTTYIFWDHAFVEKYNIDLTRADRAYLDQVFRQMKAGENDPRFYPYTLTRGSAINIFDHYDNLSASLPPIGVRHDDADYRVVNTLEMPDVIENLKFMHGWYRDGIINSDANMVDETSGKKGPFGLAQAWPSVAIAYALADGIEQYDPVRFFGPSYSTSSIQSSMNAISANSKYKKEALKFLQLVNTDTKLRDMLHLGIEGKHFEYVNNGTAVRRLQTGWPLVNYQQGSYFIETPLEDVPPGYWDEVRQQNEEATPSVMLGFMLDMEPVLSEIMNCRSVWDKYATDLTIGVVDPEVMLPRAIADLKNNGLDKVIAEAQRQADIFAASKR